MLLHHLFYHDEVRPFYNDIIIHGYGVVNQIGIFSKLCVAMFVFASGYGLAVSTPEDTKLKDFYIHRFKKLYLNYWFIWLLFVPVSIFCFNRSFLDAYGNHYCLKACLDFLGLAKMFGIDSYNPTWWFYNCIIILYLFFPLIQRYWSKSSFLIVCLSLSIGLLGVIPGINVVQGYLFPFVTGIILAKIPLKWVEKIPLWQVIIVILLFSWWRLSDSCPRHIVEAVLCASLAILLYKLPLYNWLGYTLEELGKHSMNMFLIHTFIYCYWFKDFIYLTRNPFIIYISLILSSYLFSLMIEWIKKKVGFYNYV